MSIHTPDAKETGRPGAGDQTTAGSETCDHRPSTAYRLQLRSRLIPESQVFVSISSPPDRRPPRTAPLLLACCLLLLPECIKAVGGWSDHSHSQEGLADLLCTCCQVRVVCARTQTIECSGCSPHDPRPPGGFFSRDNHGLGPHQSAATPHDVAPPCLPIWYDYVDVLYNPRRWMVYSTQARARGMETEPLH